MGKYIYSNKFTGLRFQGCQESACFIVLHKVLTSDSCENIEQFTPLHIIIIRSFTMFFSPLEHAFCLSICNLRTSFNKCKYNRKQLGYYFLSSAKKSKNSS